MPETGAERVAARPGRCANHPGVVRVAACARCGRPLCVACAIPVRGAVYGPECLSEVLEDIPVRVEPPPIRLPRGDLLAALGFGTIVVLSILPWSRFGDASGTLEAWTKHWSLLAAAAGAIGLAVSVAFWRRPKDPRAEIGVYLALAAVAGVAAYLHHRHPPPLSSASAVPLLAVGAACLAAVGAGLKWAAMLRARWARP